MEDSPDLEEMCEKCEEQPNDVICICGAKFCEPCFKDKHLARNKTHRMGDTKKSQEYWNWVTGKLAGSSNSNTQTSHLKDEASKWFGLHTEQGTGKGLVTTIVETHRLRDMTMASLDFREDSPKQQYPSIISFVGETGSGKSTLVRSLMRNSDKFTLFSHIDAPVPGAQSGDSAIMSTTGEVNLYLDPTAYGTEAPIFYADCEGMFGTEPVASQYQQEWARQGRRYLVQTKDGKLMDRNTAVHTLYPQFLYIFSDVVCYVTRNCRAWADSAARLLEWSMAGAQGTINKNSRPALIIVLNGPTVENETWVSEDHSSATKDFFRAIKKEIEVNHTLRECAKQNGDQSIQELFARNYSSVHVHYVPLEGYKNLGSTSIIMQQTLRLTHRIKADSLRVQAERDKAWTRFSSNQLALVMGPAFAHFASGSTEPFDFGQCRQRVSVLKSTEDNFSEFLGCCLKNNTEETLVAIASTLGSSILLQSLRSAAKAHIMHPSTVFNQDIMAVCERAIGNFLDENWKCRYVDPNTSERCANTKIGHALGHQALSGRLLAEGIYVGGGFNSTNFISLVEKEIQSSMRKIRLTGVYSRRGWRRSASKIQRDRLVDLRSLKVYHYTQGWNRLPMHTLDRSLGEYMNPLCQHMLFIPSPTNMCYGCLFGRPEYYLPCSHVICADCLEDFDETPLDSRYPAILTNRDCIICAANLHPDWPFQVQVRPDLTGLRVLALDGGGVRGILQLITLRRLEDAIGLNLPLGSFFDLIMGTGCGGITALGLGVQGLQVADCILKFEQLCKNGFKEKTLTKNAYLGMLAMYVRKFIYKTEPLEDALQAIFADGRLRDVYGLQQHTRVAVTTTVRQQCHFIANYNLGGTAPYFYSGLRPWEAARCTSAAPIYFEKYTHRGEECLDGGLRANNPVQLCVTEAKNIWGEDVAFDAIVSVGSGKAQEPPKKPNTLDVISEWAAHAYLLTTLLRSLDGEEEWNGFFTAQESRIKNRACRLNVKLPKAQPAPALDDLKMIQTMKEVAEGAQFPSNDSTGHFGWTGAQTGPELLIVLADRIRASMFFFQLSTISHCDGNIASIAGWIGCRLLPDEPGFAALFRVTKEFHVCNHPVGMPEPSTGKPVMFKINFLAQDSESLIHIEARFNGALSPVPISGFPMKLQTLLSYWDTHCEDLQPQPNTISWQGLTPVYELYASI